jgi:hypothetical protein
MQRQGRRSYKQLFLYDPAGEAFTNDVQAGKQAYYSYCDGIIFVIDPLSLPPWLYKQQTEASPQPLSRAVIQTYERMMTAFEMYAGVNKRQRYPQPIAVVVNKTDLFGLNNEIGLPAVRVRMKYDPLLRSEEQASTQVVRSFLCMHGLEHMVRDLELNFEHVRYFSCSALGRTPAAHETRAFASDCTLDPLLWLLKERSALP